MTSITLVFGGGSKRREEAIAANLNRAYTTVVISEGVHSGSDALETVEMDESLQVFRIAPGCPCCTGNLTMRVTLNRILRRQPQQIFLSLTNADHLPQVRHFLQDPQYQDLLKLTEDIDCEKQA